jgi:DNA-directed RNA polymerase subunit RPC12/RpoP
MKRPSWLPKLRRGRKTCPECGAQVEQTQCEVCGYEVIRKSRADVSLHKPL